ncbi:DUF2809 domain-containing protein [Micromonospora sp. NPDC007220]|uniref:ribosomal maturation YjgA family protein n=1 Tax=Micromonospora sp. NPDC007220 TaxID=3154318 RepID=UPI0033C25A03
MSITPRRCRILMLAAAVLFVLVALVVRAAAGGGLEQHSGTVLYACVVWAGVLFLRPRLSPPVAGAVAVAFCWAVELSQLTGVPAALSARSPLARLALGAQFDPVDLAWYPVGVLPLVAVHRIVAARARRRRTTV